MRAIFVLAIKDLRLLLRDRGAAFFTFVFPLAVALFFGFVFSGTSSEPLRVAAWVEAPSSAADALLHNLGEDGAFELTVAPTREEGQQLVRRGRVIALIVVPKDYATGLENVFSGGGAKLELVVDPSRRAEGGMLVGKLHEVAFRTVFSSFSDPVQFDRTLNRVEEQLKGAKLSLTDQIAFRTVLSRARSMSAAGTLGGGDGGAKPGEGATPGESAKPADGAKTGGGLSGWKPVSVEMSELPMRRGVPANSFAISFMQGIAWALFGAVLSFSSSVADERQRGTLVRLLVSPMRATQILGGKALACFLTCIATQWLLVAVGVAFFKVEVSSWGLLLLASGVTAFAFSGIMMLLAAGFRTQGASQGAGRAVLLILAMVGGGTVPVVFMPPFLRIASDGSPFKWALMASEGATWRSWGMQEMALPVGILATIGAVGLVTGMLMIRGSAARS